MTLNSVRFAFPTLGPIQLFVFVHVFSLLLSFLQWMTGSGVAIVYLIGSVVKWRGLALIGSIIF